MRYKIFIALFLCLGYASFGQFKDYETTIGYVCGGSGTTTPILLRTEEILKKENYSKVKEMLYSKVAAENFLGVVICEALFDLKKISLSEKDLERISKLYKSSALIEICNGCLLEDPIPLKTLLKNKDGFRSETSIWMNKFL